MIVLKGEVAPVISMVWLAARNPSAATRAGIVGVRSVRVRAPMALEYSLDDMHSSCTWCSRSSGSAMSV